MKRLPPYSPQLKPIELGFSNIREYIRVNHDWAVRDPIAVIHETFMRYSEHNVDAWVSSCTWKLERLRE